MKKLILLFIIVCMTSSASCKDVQLKFDASRGKTMSLTMPTGQVVKYTAYLGLYYVANVEDSTYQYMNIFVPEGATQQTPIFMPNNVGGYMAAAPSMPDAGDASGRALQEGYVVAIAGARGRNSVVTKKKKTVYTGRAPKGLLDLKAAVRYLRFFDSEILGDAEKIVTDGTSAGGAMSALLGATGNNPAYEPYLKAMGAADKRDDVFASICFCPIIDLEHADMAYEWLYGNTDSRQSLSETAKTTSKELADAYPTYFNSLNLKQTDGSPLTADNLLDCIKNLLIKSAQEAKDAGAELSDTIGLAFSATKHFQAPVNGGKKQPKESIGAPEKPKDRPRMMNAGRQHGEYVVDIDMSKYLNYVVSTQPLKGVPSFDSQGVDGGKASGENEEFGDDKGSSVNFTAYSAERNGTILSPEVQEMVRLMNPLNFIGDANSTTSKHWYVRHGAIDRDTAFSVSLILATKLQNNGIDVNYKLPWNRPHSGDYSLREVFEWVKAVTK